MIISAAKASEAAKVLGVELDTLSPDALSKAYRTATKTCHPDTSEYDPQRWASVSWAKECLVHWLERKPAEVSAVDFGSCRACGGSGRVPTVSRGFGKPLTVMCVMCNGTGDIDSRPETGDGQ